MTPLTQKQIDLLVSISQGKRVRMHSSTYKKLNSACLVVWDQKKVIDRVMGGFNLTMLGLVVVSNHLSKNN